MTAQEHVTSVFCAHVYMSVLVYSPVAFRFFPTLVPISITLAYTV